MKRNSRVLKNCASGALKGKMGIAAASSVLVSLISVMASYLTIWLFPENSTLDLILGEVFSFVLTLVLYIFQVGMYRLYLNMARGNEFSLNDLLYFFSHQPDRVLVGSFPLVLISWITTLPAVIYQTTTVLNAESTLEQQAQVMLNTSVINLAGLAVGLLLTLPLAMTLYILADEKAESGMAAIRMSMVLMKGNYWRYILLTLSFVPLMILAGIFTLGIALLFWVIPFMEMTRIMFYRDIDGELDELLLGNPASYRPEE